MLRSFFEYPDESTSELTEELIFLPHWDDAKWERLLQYTELRHFQAGDMVIRQGDTDRSFYIIIEGNLEVQIPHGAPGKMLRTRVQAASAVGEQAFLDGKPRAATLQALTPGALMSVSLEAFEVLSGKEPELARDILFELARTLSVKLRQANHFIANWVK